jgi:oxygen-independent coproporphyrinogen-3 oxidase
VDTLRRQFHFSDSPDRDISIEIDPRFISPDESPSWPASVQPRQPRRAGLRPGVQVAVNRIQSVEETRAVIDACRASGFRSVNVDLIYGCRSRPRPDSTRRSTRSRHAPDRLAVYSYAHLPDLFKPQRQIDAADLPDAETKLALLQLAIAKLTAAGYVYIGMDHFALPDDDLARAQARGSLQPQLHGLHDPRGQRPRGIGRERDQPRRRQLQPEPARPGQLADRDRRGPAARVPRHAPCRRTTCCART